MQKFILVFAIGCLPMLAFSQANKVAEASNLLAIELYKLNAKVSDNLFFSPLSVEAALAMTSAGAQTETLQQMNKTLHLGENYHPEFSLLLGQLRGNKDFQLFIANRIWGSLGKDYEPAFLDLLRKNYSADMQSLDFKNQAEPSRLKINEWVQQQTNDKIKDLLPKGIIKPNTEMVLTNAIYFKGAWREPFQRSNTQDALFSLNSGQKKKILFMDHQSYFNFTENHELQFLEMAYKGEELVMDIILPKAGLSLDSIERNLSLASIKELTQKASSTAVKVLLPKFRLETKFDLGTDLKKLGMPLAFDENKADFQGIRKLAPKERIYISNVLHKAFIDVDEQGTEAAAATAVMMLTGSGRPEKPKIFKADRPFLFFIRHVKSDAILFMGRFAKPD